MPTYVSLLNWTEQGVKGFRETADRVAKAEGAMSKLGVTFKDIYWTIGPYDVVAIVEAADEESAAAAMLAVASEGNVRSVTLRAFDRDEMARVIAKVS